MSRDYVLPGGKRAGWLGVRVVLVMPAYGRPAVRIDQNVNTLIKLLKV